MCIYTPKSDGVVLIQIVPRAWMHAFSHGEIKLGLETHHDLVESSTLDREVRKQLLLGSRSLSVPWNALV
jgi:hypothetical protein